MPAALPTLSSSLASLPRSDAGLDGQARAALTQMLAMIETGDGSVTARVAANLANGLTVLQVGDLAVKLNLSLPLAVGQEVEIRLGLPTEDAASTRLTIAPRAGTASGTAAPGGMDARPVMVSAAQLAAQGAALMPAPPEAKRAPSPALFEEPAQQPAEAKATPPMPAQTGQPAPAAQSPAPAAAPLPTVTDAATTGRPALPMTITANASAIEQKGGAPVGGQPLSPNGPERSAAELQISQGRVAATSTQALKPAQPQAQAQGQALAAEVPLPSPLIPEGDAPAGSTPTRIPYPVMRTAPGTPPPSAGPVPVLTAADLAHPAALVDRQASLAPLMQHLAQAAQLGQTPEAVRDAAWRLFAQRIEGDGNGLNGKALAAAITGAGVLETAAPEKPDIRTALLELRQALLKWIGPGVAHAHGRPVPTPPPLAGDPPRAERALLLDDRPGTVPQDRAGGLLADADGALARLKLLQLASGAGEARSTAGSAGTTEIRMEVPMMLGRELGLIQFVLEREPHARQQKKERAWRMRFALNFSASGEVGADVALLGRQTQVALWAADAETAGVLEDMLPELAPALAAKGLDLGAVRVRRGRPAARPIAPGQMLDGAT